MRRSFTPALAIATVLTVVTTGAPSPVLAAPQAAQPPPAAPTAPTGPPQSREVVAWRTETSRTIEIPGRGYRTEISTAPIHYRDAGGRWQPISPDAVVPIGPDKITDCHIVDGGYANSSYCSASQIEVGYGPAALGNVRRRILLKFDVSAIPQTAVVVDADLRLVPTSFDRSTLDFPVQAFRLAQSWTTSATWNNSGTGTWSGGFWGPTLLDSRRLTASMTDWHIYPTVQVQHWVDRSSANNGLILKAQSESTVVGVARFGSATNTDASKRPTMSVDWRVQGGSKSVNTFASQSLTDRCDLGANVGTGTLLARCTEFRIRSVGHDLTIARYYNSTDGSGSLHNADATLGLNRWKLSTGVYLLMRFNHVAYIDGSGAVYPFHRFGTFELRTPPGLDATLEENQPATGQFRLRFHESGVQYIFKRWNTNPYNWTQQLWKIIDHNQNTTELSYTTRAGWAEGALAWVKDARGRTITAGYTYDAASGKDFLTSLTDSAGRSVTYSYTGHLLRRATDTNGDITDYAYADFGTSLQQLAKITDPELNETDLSYDSNGRVTDIDRHRERTSTDNTHFTYNDTVSPATTVVRDPRSNSTTYEIQNRNYASRVTRVTDAKGQQRSTSYTSNAKVGSVTNQMGGVTTNTWGANPAIAGDATSGESVTRTVGPMGDTTLFEYPSTSKAACPTGAPSTGNGYQPICSQNSAGNRSTYTYDGPGNLSESKDQMGAVAKVERAVPNSGATPTDGRVLRSIDPRGYVTTYNYTDVVFGGRTTKRLSSITPPAGSGLGTRTVTYDGLDRLRTFTTGRSTVVTLSYDGVDRVIGVNYSDSTPDVSYTYDGNGNLTRRTDASGVATYTYNGKNQLTAKATPQGTMTYAYDGAGNLTLASEDGQDTSYGYDTVNQVITMTEPNGRRNRFAYRGDGKRTDTWYNANLTDPPSTWAAHIRVDFDIAGRLTRIKTTRASSDADGNRVADFSYCYRAYVDANTPCGTTKNESTDRSKVQWSKNNLTGRVIFYGYDGGNRLQTAWPNDSSSAYTYRYDRAGNRDVLERENAAALHYEYNSANQLCWTGPTAGTSCTSPPAGSDTRYRYDAAGNQIESPQLSALTYNGSEQTVGTTVRGGSTTSYGYAGDNQVERTSAGGTTFRNGLLGVQSQHSGATYFGRTPDGGLVTLRAPTGDYFYVFDGQGSVVGLVDPAGTHRASYTYGPYGENATATAHNGTLPGNPYRFKGEYLDAASGLYKIGARYYHPGTGRWTQQDTVEQLGDPARGNRYAYVGGDPINHSDPTGYAFWDDWDISEAPVVGRWVRAAEDWFDENSEIDSGIRGLVAYGGGYFFGATICTGVVLYATGGVGAAGVWGCRAAGTAVGTFTESLAD